MSSQEWHHLDPKHTDAKRVKKERALAAALRKSRWWAEKIQAGRCYYCEQTCAPADLTMDHVVPIARGGRSIQSNVVPSCKECNASKKLETPVDRILRELREKNGTPGDDGLALPNTQHTE